MRSPLPILALAAAASLMLQLPVFAQHTTTARPPVPLPSWFTAIDTTGSGVVTREQFVAYRAMLFEQFDTIDTDRDARLTRVEALAYTTQLFREYDIDDDGRIAREEARLIDGRRRRRDRIRGVRRFRDRPVHGEARY